MGEIEMLEKPGCMNAGPVKRPSSIGETPPRKKDYVAPALVTWGTLRDITQAVGLNGHPDGGGGGAKSQP